MCFMACLSVACHTLSVVTWMICCCDLSLFWSLCVLNGPNFRTAGSRRRGASSLASRRGQRRRSQDACREALKPLCTESLADNLISHGRSSVPVLGPRATTMPPFLLACLETTRSKQRTQNMPFIHHPSTFRSAPISRSIFGSLGLWVLPGS